MQAMRRLVRVLVVLGVAVVMASAQQAPTATPTPAAPTTPAAPATPTPATPAAPAPVAGTTTNITGVLAKGGQFNTFIRLLKSTGMASQIDNQVTNNANGLTVFAPTDNAFTSLPSGTLNSLSDQEKNALVQYHVLSTAIPMSQFDTVSNPLRTQAGSTSPGEYPLNVTSEGQQVNISTGVVNATVDNAMYTGDNLVVYQVNKVLLPAKLFGTAEAPAPAPLAPAKKKGKTPATVADSPEAEATPDATASLAAARVTGGGLAAALALAGVWWGL
ncbi:Fasciclin-like arabinogalactan protein 11 [Dichanthelium oligosanthes]|uniref:Fasciclin-like arabinogalactan protein 11 n=1 Tax=Dichanthelium oligosanthes TaxID=888268 RepID=A0A1E5WEZ9_9POAL|nr:Fasciclin-like arabinogalactan protein 11 [Dichanthelium oligosanthes]